MGDVAFVQKEEKRLSRKLSYDTRRRGGPIPSMDGDAYKKKKRNANKSSDYYS